MWDSIDLYSLVRFAGGNIEDVTCAAGYWTVFLTRKKELNAPLYRQN